MRSAGLFPPHQPASQPRTLSSSASVFCSPFTVSRTSCRSVRSLRRLRPAGGWAACDETLGAAAARPPMAAVAAEQGEPRKGLDFSAHQCYRLGRTGPSADGPRGPAAAAARAARRRRAERRRRQPAAWRQPRSRTVSKQYSPRRTVCRRLRAARWRRPVGPRDYHSRAAPTGPAAPGRYAAATWLLVTARQCASRAGGRPSPAPPTASGAQRRMCSFAACFCYSRYIDRACLQVKSTGEGQGRWNTGQRGRGVNRRWRHGGTAPWCRPPLHTSTLVSSACAFCSMSSLWVSASRRFITDSSSPSSRLSATSWSPATLACISSSSRSLD